MKIKIYKCTHEDCNRVFRTREDVEAHMEEDLHCEKCGWGIVDPTGMSSRMKFCEVCLWFKEPVSSKAIAN